MKSPRATLAATAIPFLLTSLPLAAGELPFNAPTTARAKDSAPLLHEAAVALYDSPTVAALSTSTGKNISNLWLFPTADGETVFARYNLTSGNEATAGGPGPSTEHLSVLTVRGNRIVESRELTSIPADVASNESTQLHWSASIGTGDSARGGMRLTHVIESNGEPSTSSDGTASSPHWTASIGTGAAAASNLDTKRTSSPGGHAVAASADWTSKIGTGHALDSGKRVLYASLVSSR